MALQLQGVTPLRPSIEMQSERLPNEKDLGLHTKVMTALMTALGCHTCVTHT
jgi:hypothetical protein